MRKNNMGISIQKFIDERFKKEYLKLGEVLDVLELYRIELIKNSLALYTICESCGRDHKKNPTKNKWITRI